MTFMIRTALVAALALSLAGPVAAQQSVTQADIQRLEDSVSQAQREISRLPANDSTRASRLRDELDDLRDEVIYLRVKLRKERTVTRAEYADVRDSIEDVRSRARGDAPPRSSSAQPAPPASTP